jgi:ubiquinone/menaquinone biosynthesis C-methylase UbiE
MKDEERGVRGALSFIGEPRFELWSRHGIGREAHEIPARTELAPTMRRPNNEDGSHEAPPMSKLSDPEAVAAQYAGPANFDARVRIYRLYAKAQPSWPKWLFDEIRPREHERVLEVGGGTGNLWAQNAGRLPVARRIVLSDASAGMLEAARARLAGLSQSFAFELVDAQDIPFPAADFDLTIACHMLYHVPDRSRAISELARVTAPSGRCCVATNDWVHLIELRELLARFEIENSMIRVGRDEAFFDLETATAELATQFENVRVARRQDRLDVTDASVLGDYVRSAVPLDARNLERVTALEQHVARQIELAGAFPITVAAGVCEAIF